MSWFAIKLIDFYQIFLSFDTGMLRFLAPGGACRFTVRCSEYTKIRIRELGVIRGTWEGFKRIISCR